MRGDPYRAEQRQRARPCVPRWAFRVLLLVMSLTVAAFAATPLANAFWNSFGSPSAGHLVEDSGLTSWNPNVACTADLVTIRDVLGPAYPPQTVTSSRYQTNSTARGIPQERALSPPCTITNISGQATSSFVPITGASLYGYAAKPTDCSQWLSMEAVAGDGNVGLSWQAPASDGGSPITNYQIYRGTTSGGATFLATVGTVLTYSDTSVTNGQSYFYQVTATNAAGESPRSNEVSATPNPPPPPPDFDISASPNSLTIHIGSSGTSTITLTSIGGFSGNVSLSASVACASLICLVYPTASVDPDVVSVVSGGTATSTLTVSASVLTTLGTYEVTITATSGSLTHTVTITVYVTL